MTEKNKTPDKIVDVVFNRTGSSLQSDYPPDKHLSITPIETATELWYEVRDDTGNLLERINSRHVRRVFYESYYGTAR